MYTSSSPRLVICDPALLWAEAIAELVRQHTGWQVARATTRIDEAHFAALGAQAVVFDLPDSEPTHVAHFVERLREVGDEVAPVLLTASVSAHFLDGAIASGVQACVHKSEPHSALVAALRAVQEGKEYLSPAIRRVLVGFLGTSRRDPRRSYPATGTRAPAGRICKQALSS